MPESAAEARAAVTAGLTDPKVIENLQATGTASQDKRKRLREQRAREEKEREQKRKLLCRGKVFLADNNAEKD